MLSKFVTKFATKRGYSFIEQNEQLFLYRGSSTKENPVLVWDIKTIGSMKMYIALIGYENYENFPMVINENDLNDVIRLIDKKGK